MGIASAIVLYAVIWFVVLFVVLPIRLQTQGDVGKRLIGTHAGSPANLNMKRKALIVSAIAFVVWAIVATIIISGVISVRDLDWFDRMRPGAG